MVDRLDHGIRKGRQEREDIRLDGSLLLFASPVPGCPDAGEPEQGLFLVEGKPVERFFLGHKIWIAPILGKTGRRHNASVGRSNPWRPVRRLWISNIGNAAIDRAFEILWRCRHAPSC